MNEDKKHLKWQREVTWSVSEKEESQRGGEEQSCDEDDDAEAMRRRHKAAIETKIRYRRTLVN